MKHKISLQIISGFICALLLVTSCKDNTSPDVGEPPQVPPVNSMEMDFSTFENQGQAGKVQAVTGENFTRAAITAAIMKLAVQVNIAIPKALLTAADNAEVELNENEQWEWSYSRTAGEHNFSVRLVAFLEDDNSLNWEFYVTNSQLGFDDDLFFRGVTNTDGEGIWIYYSLENPGEEEEISRIEWAVDGEDDVQLRLDITSDRNGNKGDYIEYTFNGTLKTAIYHDDSDEETTELQLNVDTKAGYIIAPDHNEGAKSCWDGNFEDVACED